MNLVSATVADFRGSAFSSNQLRVENGVAYYAGMRISSLQKETSRGKYMYTILSGGFRLGEICLSDEDYAAISPLLPGEKK